MKLRTVDLNTGFVDTRTFGLVMPLLTARGVNYKELVSYWIGKYEDSTNRIENSIAFLELAGIVDIRGTMVSFTASFRNQISLTNQDEALMKFILLTIDNSLYESMFRDIRSDEVSGQYILDNKDIPLGLSGLRDLLISFDLLIRQGDTFLLSERLEKYLSTRELLALNGNQFSRIITLDSFNNILLQREENGAKAESIALQYEKDRLFSAKTQPQQMSLINVTAGYDIKSLDTVNSASYDRFIEVKSVNSRYIRFFVTRNEMDKAKKLGKSYYLYLIDINLPHKKPYLIIPDAYKNAFQDKIKFQQDVELYRFTKAT